LTNHHALDKLKCKVEKASTLSSQQSTCLEIKPFKDGNDISQMPTHAKFEELNLDIFCKTMKPVEQVNTRNPSTASEEQRVAQSTWGQRS